MSKLLQMLAWAAASILSPALAAEYDLPGTYELVSSSLMVGQRQHACCTGPCREGEEP